MHVWNEHEGGVRFAVPSGKEDACSVIVKGPNGFIICGWDDGYVWQTEPADYDRFAARR